MRDGGCVCVDTAPPGEGQPTTAPLATHPPTGQSRVSAVFTDAPLKGTGKADRLCQLRRGGRESCVRINWGPGQCCLLVSVGPHTKGSRVRFLVKGMYQGCRFSSHLWLGRVYEATSLFPHPPASIFSEKQWKKKPQVRINK